MRRVPYHLTQPFIEKLSTKFLLLSIVYAILPTPRSSIRAPAVSTKDPVNVTDPVPSVISDMNTVIGVTLGVAAFRAPPQFFSNLLGFC